MAHMISDTEARFRVAGGREVVATREKTATGYTDWTCEGERYRELRMLQRAVTLHAENDARLRMERAAPDLLAACKAALNTPAMNADEMDPIEIEAVELARAAIRKAEGR